MFRRRYLLCIALAQSYLLFGAVGLAGPMSVAASGLKESRADQTLRPRAISVVDQVTMRRPRDPQISPDGRWVSFVVTTPDLQGNTYSHDLYVVATDGLQPPRRLLKGTPRHGFLSSMPGPRAVWTTDSKALMYVASDGGGASLHILDVGSGSDRVLLTQDELGEGVSFVLDSSEYTDVTKVWIEPSPDGRSLAFLAKELRGDPPPAGPATDHALEASGPDWRIDGRTTEIRRLWVLDTKTRHIRPLTDRGLTVDWFSWSPDGGQLAISASTRLDDTFFMGDDIYIVDAVNGALRALVKLDGWDRQPAWSPNGRYIAFGSQRGHEDWRYGATLAVIPISGGVPRFIGCQLDQIAGPPLMNLQWARNSRTIYVQNSYHLGGHLFDIDTEKGVAHLVTQEDGSSYSSFSWSRDAQTVAFIKERVSVPPEIYISSTRTFQPRRLTHLNPEWDRITVPRAEVANWRSHDGRWTIHALLVKPSTYEEGKRYPLLVVNFGGPKMVRQAVNPVSNFPLLALAEAGYVLLIPNTRGREGYGESFLHAIGDEKSYVSNPAMDVLDGVDVMIERGVADPQRLGMLGFSYGETLTMNALIRSDRSFRAAIVGGGASDLMLKLFDTSTHFIPLNRDMLGLPNTYDPINIQRAFDQTAIFFLDRVRTPVLIESGEHDGYVEHQRLFRGLRHFNIPAEHNVYPRAGHGVEEPLLLQDSYLRQLSWLDYWILDKPYRDKERQAAFDAWKADHIKQPPASPMPSTF